MDATVVIPVKNGADKLNFVLNRLYQQHTDYKFEVICIDSGSTDGSLEIIQKYILQDKETFKLYQIPKEEFGHGKTRNYGAGLGTGEFILFLTQDAVPYDEYWLQNFIDGMKLDSDIAGGFGKHYPYSDCDIFEANTLINFFEGFGKENTIFAIDKQKYENDESYRHFVIFYSDNNSCMRRSVWEKYPYPDVDFAEDQQWARKILELGYKKLYCPSAAVYHSHSYPAHTYKKRFFDEYKSLYKLHNFRLVTSKRQLLKGYLSIMKSRCIFLKNQEIPKKEKWKWLKYSIVKEWYRYYSGWLAGKYYLLSPEKQIKLDEKMSQQVEQIRG